MNKKIFATILIMIIISTFTFSESKMKALNHQESIYKQVNGTVVKIDLVSDYKTSGIVSCISNKTDELSFISPLDITLISGGLNKSNVTIISDGRFVSIYTSLNITEDYLIRNMSNNHIVPNNTKIYEKIKKIKSWDKIELTGHLVNMTWIKDDLIYSIKTSTTDTDTGIGGCEVFYVTDVKIIK